MRSLEGSGVFKSLALLFMRCFVVRQSPDLLLACYLRLDPANVEIPGSRFDSHPDSQQDAQWWTVMNNSAVPPTTFSGLVHVGG